MRTNLTKEQLLEMDCYHLRLYVIKFARHRQHLIRDIRFKKGLDIAEQYAGHRATEDELEIAKYYVSEAVRSIKIRLAGSEGASHIIADQHLPLYARAVNWAVDKILDTEGIAEVLSEENVERLLMLRDKIWC